MNVKEKLRLAHFLLGDYLKFQIKMKSYMCVLYNVTFLTKMSNNTPFGEDFKKVHMIFFLFLKSISVDSTDSTEQGTILFQGAT